MAALSQANQAVQQAGETGDNVEQDILVVNPNSEIPKLKDLYIKPNTEVEREPGTLEAHTNSFRFTPVRGDNVNILYSNIKHAFYQPCDGETIILLHFHLKDAILLGGEKQNDVAFYTEVGEMTDLGKHQQSKDRDEAENELRQRIKSDFKNFCEKVESITNQEVKFDTPQRELGFPGAHFGSRVLLQPTSGCLVSLTNWPPLVVILEAVEFVNFERVSPEMENFEAVFVFKDVGKDPAVIQSIPKDMLDHVKEWLRSCDISYSDTHNSLSWDKIMLTIRDDPESFFANGGWSIFQNDDE